MLGLEGPIAAVRSAGAPAPGAILYWPSEDAGIFLQGGTTKFLAGVGVDYRRPVMTKWDLMASARYDYHRFTTEELEQPGLLPDPAGEPGIPVRGPGPGSAMSALSRHATIALAAVVALACGDIGAPVRNDFYEWRLVVPTAGGPDTVHFHWAGTTCRCGSGSRRTKPPTCPRTCSSAIDTWESAYLYGEFRGELVSDSNTADVIVRGVPAPLKAAARTTRLPSALAPECGGATDLDITPDLTQLRLPMRVYVDPRVSLDTPRPRRAAWRSPRSTSWGTRSASSRTRPTRRTSCSPIPRWTCRASGTWARPRYFTILPPTIEAVGP